MKQKGSDEEKNGFYTILPSSKISHLSAYCIYILRDQVNFGGCKENNVNGEMVNYHRRSR